MGRGKLSLSSACFSTSVLSNIHDTCPMFRRKQGKALHATILYKSYTYSKEKPLLIYICSLTYTCSGVLTTEDQIILLHMAQALLLHHPPLNFYSLEIAEKQQKIYSSKVLMKPPRKPAPLQFPHNISFLPL